MNAARKREKAVLASAMAQGGAEASGEKIAAMMKAVVQQRHMQEQVQLAAEQQEQLQRELMHAYTKLMAQKRHEQAEARSQARATDAGAATVDVAMRKITRRVDDKWRKTEAAVTKELDLKHTQQMLALQRRQLAEISDETAQLMADMGRDAGTSKTLLETAMKADVDALAADAESFHRQLKRQSASQIAAVQADGELFEQQMADEATKRSSDMDQRFERE